MPVLPPNTDGSIWNPPTWLYVWSAKDQLFPLSLLRVPCLVIVQEILKLLPVEQYLISLYSKQPKVPPAAGVILDVLGVPNHWSEHIQHILLSKHSHNTCVPCNRSGNKLAFPICCTLLGEPSCVLVSVCLRDVEGRSFPRAAVNRSVRLLGELDWSLLLTDLRLRVYTGLRVVQWPQITAWLEGRKWRQKCAGVQLC